MVWFRLERGTRNPPLAPRLHVVKKNTKKKKNRKKKHDKTKKQINKQSLTMYTVSYYTFMLPQHCILYKNFNSKIHKKQEELKDYFQLLDILSVPPFSLEIFNHHDT